MVRLSDQHLFTMNPLRLSASRARNEYKVVYRVQNSGLSIRVPPRVLTLAADEGMHGDHS